ncbi:MAG: class I SAM-dependent methyltransferase [Rhabdochlamydiaceae bacterium]|nr:class I SAM-dependent methyltransferase [Candidatus Amphrikana amoebophyrae]
MQHENNQQVQPYIKEKELTITKRGDLEHVSVTQQLKYLRLLCEFPLGKSLLATGEISSYWIDIITQKKPNNSSHNFIESFLKQNSFSIKRWKEIFIIFQDLMSSKIQKCTSLASIPCGIMRDVFSLDFSKSTNIRLIGIDLDPNVLEQASVLAESYCLTKRTELFMLDAWKLPFQEEIDVISSCGLNIYESSTKRLFELYRCFFKSLRPGGTLLLHFLTYPPSYGEISEWKIQYMDPQTVLLDRIIFEDILNLKLTNFSSSPQMEKMLNQVGFKHCTFYYDSFSTSAVVQAKKS